MHTHTSIKKTIFFHSMLTHYFYRMEKKMLFVCTYFLLQQIDLLKKLLLFETIMNQTLEQMT